MIVDGNVTIDNINVRGNIGGVNFKTEAILTKEKPQVFPGKLNCKNIIVDDTIEGNFNYNDPSKISLQKEIINITTENIVIKNINGHRFPLLKTQVLQKSLSEDILSKMIFEYLFVKDFQVERLLSQTKIPEDLVITEGGIFNIQQDLTFFQPLEAKNIHVIRNLNQIQSLNGKLQTLLKNFPSKQFITEHITLDNLHLDSLIKLQGQIESSGTDLDKLNPVLTIDDNLILTANFSIDGVVTIWEELKFEELCDLEKVISFNKIKEEGLRLSETVISLPVYFGGGLSTDNLIAKVFNGIFDTKEWYIEEIDDLHSISEQSFKRNIYIDGITKILFINGHSVEQLYERSLRIDGDQIITGIHHYANVKTDR